jgi:hypothetical protein
MCVWCYLQGGTMIFDDYGDPTLPGEAAWPGVQTSVDSFLAAFGPHREHKSWIKVDGTTNNGEEQGDGTSTTASNGAAAAAGGASGGGGVPVGWSGNAGGSIELVAHHPGQTVVRRLGDHQAMPLPGAEWWAQQQQQQKMKRRRNKGNKPDQKENAAEAVATSQKNTSAGPRVVERRLPCVK